MKFKNLFSFLTDNQEGVQQRAIALLKAQGHISICEVHRLGTTGGSKVITRIKRKGLISGHRKEPNAHGAGFHHVYIWSGKVA